MPLFSVLPGVKAFSFSDSSSSSSSSSINRVLIGIEAEDEDENEDEDDFISALVSLNRKPVPPSPVELRKKDQCMKKISSLLALASLFSLSSARSAGLNDVQFWAGSGTNQAAMVVDWNDGKSAESLLWGYRWDGAATGLDMFEAVVNADPRLFAHLGVFSFGASVLGIGYDLNGNGSFGVSPSLSFDGGGFVVESGSSNANDSRAATEGADHFQEGWNSGFWGYNLKSSGADAWAEAFFGPADRALADGAWDGYSFAPGFNFTDPSEPLAASVVPEPGSFSLLISGALFLVCARRKKS